MNWINFFFYVIVLNSLTGTVAYLLCKLLALVAKKYNAILIIYPLYRLVLLFYIVPLGCIYIRCKCFVGFGAYAIGDGFFGNQVIYEVMQCCLLIWFSGMFFVSLHYMKTTVLTSERNALSYALVDDIVAHLSQTVNVSLTSTDRKSVV